MVKNLYKNRWNLLIPAVYGCGGRTRTYGLRVMSPTSCQLLHAAIFNLPSLDGAGDRARTGTVSLPRDFKSLVSTNSTTPANIGN